MSSFLSHRRQLILRQAEGYLDLALAGGALLPLAHHVRDRLAELALELLDREVHRGPAGYRCERLYLRGQALRMLSRHHEAVEDLAQAAELIPENVHTWLALGWCYKRLGRLDLAIESLERAMEVDRHSSIIYYNLACYWSLASKSLASNAKLALGYLTQALDLDPSYRELVDDETDFDPIRRDPRFLELTSVIV